MLPIAAQGCTLQIIGVTPGTATILSTPSSKSKLENKGIYRGTVTVQLAGCSNGTYNQTSPITGDFIITATKVKVDNELVLRVTDTTSTINVPMQNTVSPFQSTTFPATVIVSDAGQTKGLAN